MLMRYVLSLPDDSLVKADRPGHKYISKKPDGKGGWIYTYRDEGGKTYTSEEKPVRNLKQWHATLRGARSRLVSAHAGPMTPGQQKRLATIDRQIAHVKKLIAAGHTHADDTHVPEGHDTPAPPPKAPEPKPEAPKPPPPPKPEPPKPSAEEKKPEAGIPGDVRDRVKDVLRTLGSRIEDHGTYATNGRVSHSFSLDPHNRMRQDSSMSDDDYEERYAAPMERKVREAITRSFERGGVSGYKVYVDIGDKGWVDVTIQKTEEAKPAAKRGGASEVAKPASSGHGEVDRHVGGFVDGINHMLSRDKIDAKHFQDALKHLTSLREHAMGESVSIDAMKAATKGLQSIGSTLDRIADSTNQYDEDVRTAARDMADRIHSVGKAIVAHGKQRQESEKKPAEPEPKKASSVADHVRDALKPKSAKVGGGEQHYHDTRAATEAINKLHDEAAASKDPAKMRALAQEIREAASLAHQESQERNKYRETPLGQSARSFAQTLGALAGSLDVKAKHADRSARGKKTRDLRSGKSTGGHVPGTVATGEDGKRKIHLATEGGSKVVDAIHVSGQYATHAEFDSVTGTVPTGKHAVTHIPSGMRISPRGGMTPRQAREFATHMNTHAPEGLGPNHKFGERAQRSEHTNKMQQAFGYWHDRSSTRGGKIVDQNRKRANDAAEKKPEGDVKKATRYDAPKKPVKKVEPMKKNLDPMEQFLAEAPQHLGIRVEGRAQPIAKAAPFVPPVGRGAFDEDPFAMPEGVPLAKSEVEMVQLESEPITKALHYAPNIFDDVELRVVDGDPQNALDNGGIKG